MKINYPNNCRILSELLLKEGYDCYLVGGCVRDSLLGKIPHDWDMCTNATPDAMIEILNRNNIVVNPKGIKYGTVTAMFGNEEYEVTTYRKDADYTDKRHPSKVEFADNIYDDLSRRDFAINAMAYNLKEDNIIDPFSGQLDLQNKIISMVGSPIERINEDSLRIIRGLRFSIQLGFEIDEITKEAFHNKKNLLSYVSKERITDEFKKMFTCGNKISDVFDEYADIVFEMIPELESCYKFNQNNKYHQHDVYEHLLAVTDLCESNKFEIKLAALFHDIGKPACYIEDESGQGHFYGHPEVSYNMCKDLFKERFRLTNAESSLVLNLIREHDREMPVTKKSMRRFVSEYDKDFIENWLVLKKADVYDHLFPEGSKDLKSKYNLMLETYREYISEESRFTLKDMAINGNDLIKSFDLKPSKEIGNILNILFNEIIDEKIFNERNILLERAFSIISQNELTEQMDSDIDIEL